MQISATRLKSFFGTYFKIENKNHTLFCFLKKPQDEMRYQPIANEMKSGKRLTKCLGLFTYLETKSKRFLFLFCDFIGLNLD